MKKLPLQSVNEAEYSAKVLNFSGNIANAIYKK